MAVSGYILLLILQALLHHISTGVAAENSTTNMIIQSVMSTSPLASYDLSLNSTSSYTSSNGTPNTEITSSWYNKLSRTPLSTVSLMDATLITPTPYQSSILSAMSKTMILNASQTVLSVPKNTPSNKRYRNTEDIVSIAILLSFSAICSLMLLALFAKFLVDSKRRNDTFRDTS